MTTAEQRQQLLAELARRLSPDGQQLGLKKRKLDDAGAAVLAEFLRGPAGRSLAALNLSDNRVESAGGVQLASALALCPVLAKLSLAGNKLGCTGGVALADALTQSAALAELDLRGCALGAVASEALATALASNRTLLRLNLGGNAVGDKGALLLAAALHKNCTLTTLNLRANSIGTAGGSALADAVQHGNATLTDLNLGANSTEVADLKRIEGSLARNRRPGPAALAAELAQQAAASGGAVDLKRRALGDAGTAALCEALSEESCSSVTALDLRRNDITEASALVLEQTAADCKQLTFIGLQENPIADYAAARRVLGVAAVNKLRQEAQTGGEWFRSVSDRGLGDEGLEIVAAFLATDCSLQAIGLHYNGFGPQGATALAAALHTNQTLQELALYSNNIGPDGAVVLAAALAVNRGVVSVDMGGNAICDAGAMAMARALRRNATITDLHLDFNQIGEDGAEALAGALAEPQCYYCDPRIDAEDRNGSDAMVNTTLTTLWLHGNTVGNTTQRSIDAALGRNLKLVPRRIAAAYQRLAVAALFTPAFRGPAANVGGDKLAHALGSCSSKLAAHIFREGATVSDALVSARFQTQGWAWRTTQELTADVCAAVIKVAAGRGVADIRALLGTVVGALTAEMAGLADQTELEMEDMSSGCAFSSLEATTATRRKQRENVTQDADSTDGIGSQHRKKKQKQKQQKRAHKEPGKSTDENGSSLANHIATASLAAYQSQCPDHAAAWRGQVVLACFVLEQKREGTTPDLERGGHQAGNLKVVALGVGTKFLAPTVAADDSTSGACVRDSHAEGGQAAECSVLERGPNGKCQLRGSCALHLYTSTCVRSHNARARALHSLAPPRSAMLPIGICSERQRSQLNWH